MPSIEDITKLVSNPMQPTAAAAAAATASPSSAAAKTPPPSRSAPTPPPARASDTADVGDLRAEYRESSLLDDDASDGDGAGDKGWGRLPSANSRQRADSFDSVADDIDPQAEERLVTDLSLADDTGSKVVSILLTIYQRLEAETSVVKSNKNVKVLGQLLYQNSEEVRDRPV